MFSFLNPFFLIATTSIIIPIVLHMIQSRRTVKLPFSTIRFLKLAEQNASRRIRMEHFLLWLLRTLLLLVLAFAFAMPMLRTKGFGDFLRRSQRDVAIVIDTSCSMNYETGSGPVWERAVQSAAAVIEGLKPGDRVCVFAAEEEVKPVIQMLSQELEQAVTSVRALKPGFFSSQLAPAILAANDSLKQETRRREREIHVITDNQLLPWRSFERGAAAAGAAPDAAQAEPPTPVPAAAGGWSPSAVDDKTAVFFTLLGVPAPQNTAPVEVELSPRVLMVNMPSKVTAKLAHSGPPRETSVTATIDGQELGSRSIAAGSDNALSFPFVIPALKSGLHLGRIDLPPDNLPADNTFYFLLKVKEQLPTLCIGRETDTVFLMKALTVMGPNMSKIEIKRIDPADIAQQTLSDYSCVFLCDALPLPGQEVLSLERYVRGGGLLVLFPGNRATPADYEAWTALPAKPVKLDDVRKNDRKRMLRWQDPNHPILRELAPEAGVAPLLTVRRELTFGELAKDARVIVAGDAEIPFILERRFVNGSVLIVNTAADRSWSSFPLSPYYLPLLREIVQYGAVLGGFTPFIWSTRSLALADYLPQAAKASALQDPAGNEVPIRSAVVNGETVLHAENVTVPGIYTTQNEAGEREPALAVNMRREESDLAPIDPAAIEEMTGLKNSYLAFSREELLKQIEEHRIGRTLGEPLLWLALLLATLEFCYANMLSKKGPSLSEALGIATSGKVKG